MRSYIFIAARHGEYDRTFNLNDKGKKQMKDLAAAVKEVVNGHDMKISLLCSTAPRAEQGGRILIEELNPQGEVIFAECLWADKRHPADYEKAKQFVEPLLQDGMLVLVLSHFDLVPHLASFAAVKLGVSAKLSETSYGEGWLVTPEDAFLFPRV
ncbi:MAG: hypothetical protein WAV50_00040 [Minisyncoccia bacterium]